jgi:hypothetical protein
LFVQLLGPYGGKRPPDLPQGFTAYQVEEAALVTPVMQWRRPDLNIDEVTQPHRAILQGKDVISSTFEDFKARVKATALALTTAPVPKHNRAATSLVFIDADPKDLSVAEKIGEEFQAQGLFCMLPSTSAASDERLRDLEGNLIDCDVLICLYGTAPSHWVRAQLRLLAKLNAKRQTDLRILAVCTGPPRPKEPVGALFTRMREIDCGAEDWNIEPIRQLISELR